MPLVEVITGLATDPAVAQTVFATAAAWGKTPVHAASTPGFIVNRCARPFYGEALRLARRARGRAGDDRRGDARGGRLSDGSVRADGPDRSRRQFRRHLQRLGGVVPRPALHAVGLAARAGRRRLSRAQIGARLLLLRRRARSEPRRRTEPARTAARARRGPWRSRRRPRRSSRALRRPASTSSTRARTPALPAARCAWSAPAATPGSSPRTAAPRPRGRLPPASRDLLVFDLALDYAKATRLAVARADGCGDDAAAAAIGTLQAAGYRRQPRGRRPRARRAAHRRDARQRGGRRAWCRASRTRRRSISRCRRA